MRTKVIIVYAIALLLGALTGLIGSLFQITIYSLNHFIQLILQSLSYKPLMFCVSVVLTLFLVLIPWFLVQKIAPEAAGSGVQEIEGTLLHLRPIFWKRLIPVKFIGGVMAISAKMVLGREGPTIQMGGNLGAMLGAYFNLKPERCNTLIAAGAAAGLATAFNAPLAGVLFVIEEMRNEFNFNFTNFKMVALSCVMATISTHFILGANAAIPMSIFTAPSLHALWLFFFFGCIMGIAGLIFNLVLMKALAVQDALTQKQRFLYVIAIAILIGILRVYSPSMVGGGYEIIEQALNVPPAFTWLIYIILIRYMTTILCYSTAIPGGIFAPMLALGTLLGLASYKILEFVIPDMSIQPGMFAVAGMGALFSAAVRAPITGIILVVEMTRNYSLILPLMVSCLTSTTIVQLAKNQPIYTQLLHRTMRKQRDMS